MDSENYKPMGYCGKCKGVLGRTQEKWGFICDCPCHTPLQELIGKAVKQVDENFEEVFYGGHSWQEVNDHIKSALSTQIEQAYTAGKEEMLEIIARNEGWENSYEFYKERYL